MVSLVLASASQGRANLLRAAGYDFVQQPSNAPEPSLPQGVSVRNHLLNLARMKALAVARQHPSAFVIGADTSVHVGRRLFGKPGTLRAARQMLSFLAGRSHEITTALCVVGPGRPGCRRRVACATETARVTLRRCSHEEIRRHVAVVKPTECAGAYALQGPGAAIVRRVEGDPSTVIGLPLESLARLLKRLGYRPAQRFSSRESRPPIRRAKPF